jgi:hypothetical protein
LLFLEKITTERNEEVQSDRIEGYHEEKKKATNEDMVKVTDKCSSLAKARNLPGALTWKCSGGVALAKMYIYNARR